jgi:GNAT superfamily N-acetyltransferase
MIRAATLADLPTLLELGAVMAAELPHYGRFRYAPHKVERFIGQLIESEDGFVHVAVRDGQIVGAMAGMVTEHWMSEDKIGTELTVYMLPAYRGSLDSFRMIRAFVQWTQSRGAVMTNMGICTETPDVDRVVTFYERIGLRPFGFIFEAPHGNQ